MSEELDKLKELYKSGYIDKADYQHRKGNIVDRIVSSQSSSHYASASAQATEVSIFRVGDAFSDGNFTFKLWRRLGEGGMGEVWLALSERLQSQGDSDPFVAIKFIGSTRIGTADAKRRLMEEGNKARKLRHSHIISTLNVYDDGIYIWVEMEYLGRDLTLDTSPPPEENPPEPERIAYTLGEYRHLKAGDDGLPLEEVVQLLRPVSEALDYAREQHNLIHRDIKASNVMRCEGGRIVLMDFGLAHRLQRGSYSGLGDEIIIGAGTIEYRAPETFRAHKPSRRQDVHSLSVLAYELLTGQLPWDGLGARRRGDGPPIGTIPPPQMGLEEAIYEVLRRGMAYDPRERPGSAGELIESLASAPEHAKKAAAEAERERRIEASREKLLEEEREARRRAEKAERDKKEEDKKQEIEAQRLRETEAQAEATSEEVDAGANREKTDYTWVWLVGGVLAIGGIFLVKPGKVEDPQYTPVNKPTVSQSQNAPIPEMISIPSGSFDMGCLVDDGECDDDEKPVQKHVEISAFKLARTEVTVGDFRAFVDDSGYETTAEKNSEKGCYTYSGSENKWIWQANTSWRDPGFKQNEDHPVVCVSWLDAQAYIVWLNELSSGGYRLPKEAEWEYAARGESKSKYYFGNSPTTLCEYGNVADTTTSPSGKKWTTRAECDDGYWYTAPVGTYADTWKGLKDIHGNVWEWTCSAYETNYNGEEQRCAEDSNTAVRVLRGGSWSGRPGWLRSANRGYGRPGGADSYTGFRLAQDL